MLKFVRTLKEGDHGPDVAGVQLLLNLYTKANPHAKTPVRPYGIKPDPIGHNGHYGPATAGQMDHVRKNHNDAHPHDIIPTSGGMYGPRMHAVLEPYSGPMVEQLMKEAWEHLHPPDHEHQARLVAVQAMQYWYGHKRGYSTYSGPNHSTIYRREDGIQNRRRLPDVPHYADCSSGTQWALWLAWLEYSANVIDPGQNNWGWDTTANMVLHGAARSASNCKPGDLVFNGTSVSNTVHVSMVMEFIRGVPWTIGFGHQGGPTFNPYNYHNYPVVAIRDYFKSS